MMLPDIVRDLPLIVMCSEILKSPEYFEPRRRKRGSPAPAGTALLILKSGTGFWPECCDEKVDLGCEPAACFLCCGPAGSSGAARKLDRNSGINPDFPRQVVRPGSPAQQKYSSWFLDTPQREKPDRSGRHLVSPEISGRLARHMDSPN